MSHVLVVDVFETDFMANALSKLLTVHRQNLVPLGVGDYYWDTGTRYSLEHKSGDQAVSESGQRLDRQLRTHMSNADVVGLVISNIVSPSRSGNCLIWKKDYVPGPRPTWRWRQLREVNKPFTAYMGYLWQLHSAGIGVYQFDSRDSLALGIAEFVYNSHKPNHTTLQKHQRPIVNLIKKKIKGWKPNPFIETLMGTRNGGIGEVRATKLIEKYKTPANVYKAKAEELFQILGQSSAIKFMRAIGRI